MSQIKQAAVYAKNQRYCRSLNLEQKVRKIYRNMLNLYEIPLVAERNQRLD